MGDGYGPIVVAREPMRLSDLRGSAIAVPGPHTTGLLALRLYLNGFSPVMTPFDRILDQVRAGAVTAGVVIHEGQLTWQNLGLHKIADLGELWKQETGLPLPLGLDVVRKDLGLSLAGACTTALRRSIEYAQAHETEAMEYALQYGRGLDLALGRRFVGMYVNHWTLDMGEEGRRALQMLLDRAAAVGLVPGVGEISLV
jgi:1,4-dihydroxy-6-naphthoate synthase